MNKLIAISSVFFLCLLSCHKDKDDDVFPALVTLKFNHSWDDTPITASNFNTIEFTNAHGEELSITKLRYLISKITFQKENGETYTLDGYNLVDITNGKNLSFTPKYAIPVGTYSRVFFTFGFDNEDNYNNYQDLNSESWNVPEMLGGGYHFMQLEGKFIDNTSTETGYAYHTIRAVDNTGPELVFEDTFFEVDLGEINLSKSTTFNINMNVSEWFKNPNTWDLNQLNNMLMPNYDAQILMYENGQSVFSLESIDQ
ncbi:MbnP family protein [Tamlana sp. I1]|uniref:MbnP family protein n=1 Tax=Tamlana sp. I1 TaxID=2762061 RepID=UPI00188FC5AF|nr:MbnP family protein [Tamlana sp. I1]